MTIGENIKRLRERAGHTNAAAFARSIGVSPGTLGDWEAGTYRHLRADSLLKIASAIPCSLEDLVEGVNENYEESKKARAVSATAALLQGSASTEPEQALKKGSPGSGKTLAPHQENATESASSTPAQVGEGRAQGGSDDAHGTEGQSAPTPRREPVATNAEIAAQLSKYAGWLAQSGEIQAALVAAAMALACAQKVARIGTQAPDRILGLEAVVDAILAEVDGEGSYLRSDEQTQHAPTWGWQRRPS